MSAGYENRPLRKAEYWLVLASIAIVSVCSYGIRAAAVYGLACVTAVLTDLICLFLQHRSYRRVNLNSIGTGLLLAMMMPATIPYSILLLSTVFAVAVGTHVFGARKSLLFPPAAVGYLFALLCWKKQVLQFPEAGQMLRLFGNQVELHPSFGSTLLTERYLHTGLTDLLLGTVYTPMGTGCLLLILVGTAVLLFRRQISGWSCLGYLTGLLFSVVLFGIAPAVLLPANMVLFAMLFFVSDPSVMPCRSVMAYLGALITGIFTVYLLSQMQLEFAPVAAVMLSSPLWYGLASLETRFFYPPAEDNREEAAANAGE